MKKFLVTLGHFLLSGRWGYRCVTLRFSESAYNGLDELRAKKGDADGLVISEALQTHQIVKDTLKAKGRIFTDSGPLDFSHITSGTKPSFAIFPGGRK